MISVGSLYLEMFSQGGFSQSWSLAAVVSTESSYRLQPAFPRNSEGAPLTIACSTRIVFINQNGGQDNMQAPAAVTWEAVWAGDSALLGAQLPSFQICLSQYVP